MLIVYLHFASMVDDFKGQQASSTFVIIYFLSHERTLDEGLFGRSVVTDVDNYYFCFVVICDWLKGLYSR